METLPVSLPKGRNFNSNHSFATNRRTLIEGAKSAEFDFWRRKPVGNSHQPGFPGAGGAGTFRRLSPPSTPST
jgi:hypothetical protein